MREETTNWTDPATKQMYVRGWLIVVAGFLVALLAGFTALTRGSSLADHGESMSTTPHIVWAAIGGLAIICGTVRISTAQVIEALGSRADARVRQPLD